MPLSKMHSFYAKLKRGLRQMWFCDIWHLQPSAPLSWRYFLPNQSTQIKLHRKLWWHSPYKLPRIVWLPLEFGRYLHWQLWAEPRGLKRAVESYGAEVETRFGLSTEQQRKNLSYWAKHWCINPYTGYSWGLYRADADGLQYIYNNQASAFHAMQNQKTGASKADHRLLGDKIALAEKLTALGVPMVATARVSSGDWQDLLDALTVRARLFCKLRSGNQGESAFAVWQGEQGIQGVGFDGKLLNDYSAVQSAWLELTAKGAVLIQPLLQNHADIAPAGAENVAITIRVITRSTVHGGMQLLCASLEVPTEPSKASDSRGYCIFPITKETGKCQLFGDAEWLDEQSLLQNRETFQKLAHDGVIPYWQELQAFSLLAHSALPKVWAIAWDWVITPTGPVLLEGNSGWGMDTPQMQLGGFAGNA